LSKFSGQSERVAIAVALDLVQHTKPFGVSRRIVVVAEEPQTAPTILVDEPIDIVQRRLMVFGMAAAHRCFILSAGPSLEGARV